MGAYPRSCGAASYDGDDAAKPAIVLMQAEAQILDGSPRVSRAVSYTHFEDVPICSQGLIVKKQVY
jgi:hypothetical protein